MTDQLQVTGRYEAPGENGTGEACCVTSEEEDPTPIATHPAPGQLAPPPTPATISPSLENGNGSLEPISEGDSLDLAAASRPASPEKGSKETCLDKDIEETVADGTGLTEAAESESDEPGESAASHSCLPCPLHYPGAPQPLSTFV